MKANGEVEIHLGQDSWNYLKYNKPNSLKLNPVCSIILGVRHNDAGVRITKATGTWACKENHNKFQS